MIQTFYAVELTVLKVVADVDEHQATIPGTHSTQETLRAHYDGSYPTEAEAMAAFDRCELALHAKRDP